MKRSIGNAEFMVIAKMATILNDVMVLIIVISLNTYSCYLKGLIPQHYIVGFIRYYIKYGKKTNKAKNKWEGAGTTPARLDHWL